MNRRAYINVVHASRDKILLEGDDDGGSDDGDEDEVFALKGMPDDGSSSDEDENEGPEYGSDDDIDHVHYAAAESAKKEKKKQGKAKGKKGKQDESGSEDEDDESEEEEGWGTKKSAYYASNAEQLESDDEEANELEEQEAKRLQTKARDAMADDDFGLGDVVEGAPEDVDGDIILRGMNTQKRGEKTSSLTLREAASQTKHSHVPVSQDERLIPPR